MYFVDRIESPRLIIRSPAIADAPAPNAAIRESHAELAPWLDWVTPLPTLEATCILCERADAQRRRGENWMVLLIDKTSREIVGASGLHRPDWSAGTFEVGYWARSGGTGRGLITEAVNALCVHAFDALHAQSLWLTTDAANHSSRRLAERAGFFHEHTRPLDRQRPDGTWRDTCVYTRRAVSADPGFQP